MKILARAMSLALCGSAIAVVEMPAAFAQVSQAQTTETITVVGSRRANASATDTPVPVDVIPMSKVAEQGGTFDLAQTLQYISPSFNSTRQTGADNADLIDSAALRGLGSDQTLVLVNGKRRHTTALVNLFGARNRGNTGTDLNAIPMLAIDTVQVLRDGAAAQYGSDAIAGVIDIVLKKRPGCEAVAGYGQYSAGDGKNYLASAYCGLQVGEKGVIAVTAEFLDRGRSNRAEADNPRIIGDTKVRNETLYVNGDLPTSDTAAVYFTLGGQKRDASSAAFARGGIGSDDIPSRNAAAMYPDGFVPFINGDIDASNYVLGKSPGYALLQATVRGTVKLRFMAGLACYVADAVGRSTAPHVQAQLGDLIAQVEVANGLLHAAARDVVINRREGGSLRALAAALWVFIPQTQKQAVEVIRQVGGSGLIMTPTAQDFHNPEIAPYLEKYLQGKNLQAQARVQLFKLAWDMLGEQFGSRQLQYEWFYAGDPLFTRSRFYRSPAVAHYKAMVDCALGNTDSAKRDKS